MRSVLQGYLRVGRRAEFRRFWLGMMISRAGDAFTTVALSWVVLSMAGPVQLGLVLMCYGLPRIVSGPVAGRLIDRFPPRVLLTADNAARGMLTAAVPVLLWSHHLIVADLYGIAAVSALLSSVTEVAEAALVPRLVDDDQLDAANSLLSANWELAYIVGPAVAGTPLAGRLPPAQRIGTVILAGVPLFALLRLAPDLVVAVILLGLASFSWGPYYVLERTLVQRLVPDNVRGRLFGVRMAMSSPGFPLGSALGGVLIGAAGVRTVILVIAGGCLAFGLLPLLVPALRQLADPPGSRCPRRGPDRAEC